MSTPIPVNHVAFSAAELSNIFAQDVRVGACGVRTDSRAVHGGELFVALRGERFDAHAFLQAVEAQGAALAVVETPATTLSLPQVHVPDSLVALGALARRHRERWSGSLVAITGSAGKTTTKSMLAHALGASHAVHQTPGNLNNRIGLPHVLFGLEAHHTHAVIELGTSLPGEIETLADIARPQVGVVTLVAPVHTEGLGTLADVAKEKCALLAAVPASGHCVWNTDVSILERTARDVCVGTAIRYGEHERADVRLMRWQVAPEGGTVCEYQTPSGVVEVRLSLLGEAAVKNVGAVLAVGVALGENLEDMAKLLSQVEHVKGRMFPVRGALGQLVIDDSYNASPASVDRAIDSLASFDAASKRVLFLGDMLELGELADDHHQLALERVAQSNIDLLVVCGEAFLRAARRVRFPGAIEVHRAENSTEAAVLAQTLMKQGPMSKDDIVLVKGSRGMRMERVVEALANKGNGEGAS